ncbi:bifunctional helix-turn-helix transcriptional regulator/GNAT family N-acetyltransferase [Pseudoxanthomonas sacheonensis]|uniref:bifunctional helix-turn-helix transcriptional regulator/GNAT family N-acetyltransferase n=1 Tax=Pseudoxanthomonas sacheonensis TaxID=443615 RepID=UPI0013D2AEAD|nr:helix-turn-helix domain-containing GNAT family N-acetyltransferase [Pseudoxanthomonas sacheonensis]KAF1711850.1 MarR family transcriptional regulator [Pseudoxanthomonas sacheonensis]
MDKNQIRQVRNFNRAVTQRIGVLSDDYLGRGRPLGESRLLFEIGRSGADLRDLRARLALDSGYLSRMLRSLEAQGLVDSQRAAGDGRVRRAVLTRKGLGEFDALDRRSQDFATSLLASLGAAHRERMVTAMAGVERLMRASAVTIEPADPASADARMCIEAYFSELEERFETGFDPARTVSADPEELMPPAGRFLIARLDGRPVGCGGLKTTGPKLGEIKRMWVAPDARGLGIAQRLLDAMEEQAVRMGLDTLQLDTNRALTEARALYARNGYREIPRYNDNPYAHHWFEKRELQDHRSA